MHWAFEAEQGGKEYLLGAKHEVYIPAEHPDYAAFTEELRRDAPELSLGEELQFVKETCNHDGKR